MLPGHSVQHSVAAGWRQRRGEGGQGHSEPVPMAAAGGCSGPARPAPAAPACAARLRLTRWAAHAAQRLPALQALSSLAPGRGWAARRQALPAGCGGCAEGWSQRRHAWPLQPCLPRPAAPSSPRRRSAVCARCARCGPGGSLAATRLFSAGVCACQPLVCPSGPGSVCSAGWSGGGCRGSRGEPPARAGAGWCHLGRQFTMSASPARGPAAGLKCPPRHGLLPSTTPA